MFLCLCRRLPVFPVIVCCRFASYFFSIKWNKAHCSRCYWWLIWHVSDFEFRDKFYALTFVIMSRTLLSSMDYSSRGLNCSRPAAYAYKSKVRKNKSWGYSCYGMRTTSTWSCKDVFKIVEKCALNLNNVLFIIIAFHRIDPTCWPTSLLSLSTPLPLLSCWFLVLEPPPGSFSLLILRVLNLTALSLLSVSFHAHGRLRQHVFWIWTLVAQGRWHVFWIRALRNTFSYHCFKPV